MGDPSRIDDPEPDDRAGYHYEPMGRPVEYAHVGFTLEHVYDVWGRLPGRARAEAVAVEDGRLAEPVNPRASPAFAFEHDAARGVFRLTWPDGTVEVFRDRPARHLCVEPDEAGVMRPVVRHGRPVFLYLCREEREVR